MGMGVGVGVGWCVGPKQGHLCAQSGLGSKLKLVLKGHAFLLLLLGDCPLSLGYYASESHLLQCSVSSFQCYQKKDRKQGPFHSETFVLL